MGECLNVERSEIPPMRGFTDIIHIRDNDWWADSLIELPVLYDKDIVWR